MADLLSEFVVRRTDRMSIQFVRYLFVGGFATVVDMGIFFAINTGLRWHYLVAQTCGFLAGITVNYFLSIGWVFRSTGRLRREVLLFTLVGVGGLLLSYLLLWLLIDLLGLHALRNMVAKAIVVFLVLIWNFGARRRFVFSEGA